jgi:FMN phosphatase YigB (HAD superfamily)
VPFLSGSEDISRSAEFIRFYEEIPEKLREQFRADFSQYRKKVQAEYRDLWIHLNTVNPDILSLLRKAADIRIISGKDAPSIKLILQHHGIFTEPDHIHGRLGDKRPVLRSLAEEAVLAGEQLLFCDDNFDNVMEAVDLGIRSVWALWGYHTPEHLERAHAIGRTGMQSDEFVSLVCSAAAQSPALDATW